jgi:hypothetical protein
MEISLVSSLTPEDEARFAAALIGALGSMLDLLPIAYSIRVETVSGKQYDRTHSPSVDDRLEGVSATNSAVLDSEPQPVSPSPVPEPVGSR